MLPHHKTVAPIRVEIQYKVGQAESKQNKFLSNRHSERIIIHF